MKPLFILIAVILSHVVLSQTIENFEKEKRPLDLYIGYDFGYGLPSKSTFGFRLRKDLKGKKYQYNPIYIASDIARYNSLEDSYNTYIYTTVSLGLGINENFKGFRTFFPEFSSLELELIEIGLNYIHQLEEFDTFALGENDALILKEKGIKKGISGYISLFNFGWDVKLKQKYFSTVILGVSANNIDFLKNDFRDSLIKFNIKLLRKF